MSIARSYVERHLFKIGGVALLQNTSTILDSASIESSGSVIIFGKIQK